MASSDQADAPRRLHPLSVLFHVVGAARQFIVWLIVILFAGTRHGAWEIWLALFAIPVASFGVYRYLTTTYQMTRDQLVVRKGLVFRSERHIPFGRIQNIDLVQNVFHRLLRMAEVRIETASGSEPEAALSVLAVSEVERIRERVFAQRTPAPAEAVAGGDVAAADERGELAVAAAVAPVAPVAPVPLVELSLWDLVTLGLITFKGFGYVLAAWGLAWQFDLGIERRVQRWLEINGEAVFDLAELPWFVVLTLGAAALLLVLALLSIVWAVVTLFGYRLVRVGEDLRVSCGLFTRLTATIPRQRIQLVSVRESLLHRLLGRVTVSVETAGGSGDEDSVPVNRRWLVPLARRERLPELLREIQPHIELVELEWRPLASAAARRALKRTIVLGLALGLPLLLVLAGPWLAGMLGLRAAPAPAPLEPFQAPGPWWIAILLLLLSVLAAYALTSVRAMRYASSSTGVAFRSGVFTRRTSGTRVNRIQVITRHQSPFDRRWGMATVAVDTAGAGPAGHQIEIPYLDFAAAESLRSDLVALTAETPFHWT